MPVTQILGTGIDDSQGMVLSVSEQTGMVTLQLDLEGGEDRHPRYSDTIQVPITRVMPVRNEVKLCFDFKFVFSHGNIQYWLRWH